MFPLLISVLCAVLPTEPAAVDGWLRGLHTAAPDFGLRVQRVAESSVGIDYADGPLGEGPAGQYDKDPLINLAAVDCVTFVEQTLALAAMPNHAQAFDLLQQIRYENGRVDYESRNHFFISDWIANNKFCTDVTEALGVPVETVTRTISRRNFFKRVEAPDVGQQTPDEEVTLSYVFSGHVAVAETKLPSPALIVFIGKMDWLFALHCGLYIRDEAGNGLLYHASSKSEKVVSVPLPEYLQQNASRYIGITAYSIGNPVRP